MLPLLMLLPAVHAAGVVVENGFITQFPAYPGTASNAPGLSISYPTKENYYDVTFRNVVTSNTTSQTAWRPNSNPNATAGWPVVWKFSEEYATAYSNSYDTKRNPFEHNVSFIGLELALFRSNATGNSSSNAYLSTLLRPEALACTQYTQHSTAFNKSACSYNFLGALVPEYVRATSSAFANVSLPDLTPGDGYYVAIYNKTDPLSGSYFVAVSEQFSLKNTTIPDPDAANQTQPGSSIRDAFPIEKGAALGLAIPTVMVAACTLLGAIL